jgi:predicted  nucleic acid-binding Zn-ribbon protein
MFSEDNRGGFKLPTLKCVRCGHTWPPRTQNLPKVCPKCKSPYWNTAKRVKKSEEQDEKKEIIEGYQGRITAEPQDVGISEVQTPAKEVVKDEKRVYPPYLCCKAQKRYGKDEDDV